jgi:hypothetical protein
MFCIPQEGALNDQTRPGAATGLALLSTNAALAQSGAQCDQVRAAVAKYGYKTAKAYAQANMSPEAVRAADSCIKHRPAANMHVAARKRYRRHRTTD